MTSKDDWEEGEIRDNYPVVGKTRFAEENVDGNVDVSHHQLEDGAVDEARSFLRNELREGEEREISDNEGEICSEYELKDEDGSEDESEYDLKNKEKDRYQGESMEEYRWDLDEELVRCSSIDDGEIADEIVRTGKIIPASEFSCMKYRKVDQSFATDTYDVISGNATGNHPKSIKEIQADDSWIFHTLGDKTEENPQNQNTAEQERVLPEQSFSEMKHINEMERKFAEEKENYVRNMYSLLVTAREQIVDLQKKNKKLKTKLHGNYSLKCPECKYQLSVRNNSLQPKYTKILKGRCAIEMSFINMAVMEEWLVANNLDINPDGLPVFLKSSQQPTLASTNSLLAAKQNRVLKARETLDKNTKLKADPTGLNVFDYFESRHTVVAQWEVQPTGTANDFVNRNAKDYGKPGVEDVLCCPSEKRNHRESRKKKEQRHNKKRSRTDICEEQPLRSTSPGEGLQSLLTSAYDQQRFLPSCPSSPNFHASCWGAEEYAERCATSVLSSCKTDCKYTLKEIGGAECPKHLADRYEHSVRRRSAKRNHHRSRSKMDSKQQRSPLSWHSKRKSCSKRRNVRN